MYSEMHFFGHSVHQRQSVWAAINEFLNTCALAPSAATATETFIDLIMNDSSGLTSQTLRTKQRGYHEQTADRDPFTAQDIELSF